jgi:hypothetical protein
MCTVLTRHILRAALAKVPRRQQAVRVLRFLYDRLRRLSALT